MSELKLAKRDSEIATRPYVIVNPLLAKHLPIAPTECLGDFYNLQTKIKAYCGNEPTLSISFAETATLLGAYVSMGTSVHTTREPLPEKYLVAEFKEEHSHAKEQALYLLDEYRDLSQYKIIVFIDDEITTGKTILNFLKQVNWTGKIVVAALVFNNFNREIFKDYDAEFACITELNETPVLGDFVYENITPSVSNFKNFKVENINVKAEINPRLGCLSMSFTSEAMKFIAEIPQKIGEKNYTGKDICVIGTEEYMFPAFYLCFCLKKKSKSVVTHSTTRSPLLPSQHPDYPFHSRVSFKSPYDENRITHLYNLKKYDIVIIVTDAKGNCDDLIEKIQSFGNDFIYLVKIKY